MSAKSILDNHEANEMRLIAAQIIYDLWEAGQVNQLRMLEVQARMSREKLVEGLVPNE